MDFELCTSPWASCQIGKIAGYACAGNAQNVFPHTQLRDPDMRHATCVTHVPWCMPGSLTSGFLWSRGEKGGGENAPGILGACATGVSRRGWWRRRAEHIPPSWRNFLISQSLQSHWFWVQVSSSFYWRSAVYIYIHTYIHTYIYIYRLNKSKWIFSTKNP